MALRRSGLFKKGVAARAVALAWKIEHSHNEGD